ncbi:hypothetical protein [Nocardia gipuzkoensis]
MARIEMKQGALYELRRAPKVRQDLERRARAVQDACGGPAAGYLMSSTQGAKKPQGRWRTAVFTANIEAMLDNRRNNTLVRAFRAARGG